jgi:hypothetical protein
MRYSSLWSSSEAESPPRNSRNSPSEQTDEAPGLIERDQVDIEREIPTDDSQGIERIEPCDADAPPAFED